MEKRFELIKTNELKEELGNDIQGDIYKFLMDDINIGFSIISNDNFYIRIYDEYQSNGYGNKLYLETLKNIKDKKDITVDVDINNYKMINIILNNKGIEIANGNGIKSFLIVL